MGSLLLLHSSTGDTAGLKSLAVKAEEAGSNNIAFSSLWLSGDIDASIELLIRTGRISEAVLFCQTYKPSKAPGLVKQWKESLDKQGKSKVARLIGVPGEDDELFPEWDDYIRIENEGPKENLIDINGTAEETEPTNGTAETDGLAQETES